MAKTMKVNPKRFFRDIIPTDILRSKKLPDKLNINGKLKDTKTLAKRVNNEKISCRSIYHVMNIDLPLNGPLESSIKLKLNNALIKYAQWCEQKGDIKEALEANKKLNMINQYIFPHSNPDSFGKVGLMYQLMNKNSSAEQWFSVGIKAESDIFSALYRSKMKRKEPLDRSLIDIDPVIKNAVWNLVYSSPRPFTDTDIAALERLLKDNATLDLKENSNAYKLLPFVIYHLNNTLLNDKITMDNCINILNNYLMSCSKQAIKNDGIQSVWERVVQASIRKSSLPDAVKSQLEDQSTIAAMLFLENGVDGLFNLRAFEEFNANSRIGNLDPRKKPGLFKIDKKFAGLYKYFIYSEIVDTEHMLPFLTSRYPLEIVGLNYGGWFSEEKQKDFRILGNANLFLHPELKYTPKSVNLPIRNEVGHLVSDKFYPFALSDASNPALAELFDTAFASRIPKTLMDDRSASSIYDPYNKLNASFIKIYALAKQIYPVQEIANMLKTKFTGAYERHEGWYMNAVVKAMENGGDSDVAKIIAGQGLYYFFRFHLKVKPDGFTPLLDGTYKLVQERADSIPTSIRNVLEGVTQESQTIYGYNHNRNVPDIGYKNTDDRFGDHEKANYYLFLIKKKMQAMVLKGEFNGPDGKINAKEVMKFYKYVPFYLAYRTLLNNPGKSGALPNKMEEVEKCIENLTKNEVLGMADFNDPACPNKIEFGKRVLPHLAEYMEQYIMKGSITIEDAIKFISEFGWFNEIIH